MTTELFPERKMSGGFVFVLQFEAAAAAGKAAVSSCRVKGVKDLE